LRKLDSATIFQFLEYYDRE